MTKYSAIGIFKSFLPETIKEREHNIKWQMQTNVWAMQNISHKTIGAVRIENYNDYPELVFFYRKGHEPEKTRFRLMPEEYKTLELAYRTIN